MSRIRTMYRVVLAVLAALSATTLALALVATITTARAGEYGASVDRSLATFASAAEHGLWAAFGLLLALTFAHGLAGSLRFRADADAGSGEGTGRPDVSEHAHPADDGGSPRAAGAAVPPGTIATGVRRSMVRNVDTLGDEVQEAYLLQRRLLRGIGHDLRSPLASIAFTSETIASGALGPLTPEQVEALNLTAQTAHRLASQAEVLYAYDEGRRGLDGDYAEPVDVVEAVVRVVDALRASAIVRGLEVDLCVLCGPGTCNVHVDHRIFERAVANIVDNAIKFTDEGTITVTVLTEGGEVRVGVADTGIGIPSDEIARVTDVYFRSPAVATRPGSGIGLAVTREFAAEMGGELAIVSEVGRGTTVTLHLPIDNQ